MTKISDIYRWLYGLIRGRPTNFNWIIERKLAGSGVPMSKKEARWLISTQGIRTIVTIKEKPLSQEWLNYNNGANTDDSDTKIDYLHISVQDYGAPSLKELDYVVNYISQQIDRTSPVMVHCSGGKGRTGTILAAYLIKKENGMTADKAISRLSRIRGESIQSKDQEKILFDYEKYVKGMQDKKSNY
jgi:atypical dual specificity phosphatase